MRMDAQQQMVARQCMDAAERNSMTFPQIVGALMKAGFESYTVDLRRAVVTFYLPDGEGMEVRSHASDVAVAPDFDAGRVRAAIREAQTLAPGYTYKGFCEKVKRAGCAGYMVSFPGRRAVYFGRTAETHVELFPPAE